MSINRSSGKIIELSAQGSKSPLRVQVVFKDSANGAAVQVTSRDGGAEYVRLEVDQLEQLAVHQLEEGTGSAGFHFHFQDDLLMPCFTQPCTVPPPPDTYRTEEFTLNP